MQASSGILLIGHGTRDQSGTHEFFELSDILDSYVKSQKEPMAVAPCLLEFQEPTITQAWDSLVDRGCRHIHVAPLLLFSAGHARHDIPAEINTCVNSNPEITWDQSLPLSRHPAIVELLRKRVDDAITPSEFPVSQSALVMVGRGNRNCCAQSDMRILTEIVARPFSFAHHRTAFYAMAEPPILAVVTELARRGLKNVVVQPHLLFQGRLFDAINAQVDAARKEFPNINFVVGNYLGPLPTIAQAIADRVFQASGAAARSTMTVTSE